MPKARETVLEIDLKALKHNFEYLKSKIKSQTKFLAVVKAFGYGTDASRVAKHLEDLGADYFAVAYASEGISIRKAGITKPIIVLHPQAVNFKALIDNNLEPSLYNTKVLNEFIRVASKANLTKYPIHIKFNTGLNRIGFGGKEVNTVTSILKETQTVYVKSIFSHLAASEDLEERPFSEGQIKIFKTISNTFIELMEYKPLLHMCNTSGILNYPEAHFDMVRSGIGLCGFGNSEKENKNFKPIATLKTIISQIHSIEKGESVGYNRAFKSNSIKKTGTLPIGHADGISRQFGNEKGYVTIQGQRVPIIGNVCMDMIMIDVTDIDCNEGDEVVVFGKNNTAEDFANTANTISYELLTAISQRVKRIFLK